MEKLTINDVEFELIYKCDYSSLFYNEKLLVAVCIAKQDYIPINNFKSMFLAFSDLIEKYPIIHLVFDKRSLRTFHQPSMEWYFAIWKPMVKEKGLVNHYKLLPELDWFEKAVEAGKHEIFKKYSKDILNGITITYVKTMEKAIEHLTKK